MKLPTDHRPGKKGESRSQRKGRGLDIVLSEKKREAPPAFHEKREGDQPDYSFESGITSCKRKKMAHA